MSDEILKPSTPYHAAAKPASDWVQGFSPLSTGTRVGELTILSVLGAGEYGITYVTEHAGRGKRYALKEYFPRTIAYRDGPTVRALAAGMPEFTWGLDRFLAEARSLQKVRHPSIIAVHGVTEVGGTGYVGMNYEQGRDLGIWLHEFRRLPTQEEIDKLLVPLLQGLEGVHAAGMLHYDIGPDSILIRDDGTPVLVDFGGCRVGMRRRTDRNTTARHAYSAPELLGSGAVETGPRTDIYALAATLYYTITGQPPPAAHERLAGDTLKPVAGVTEGRYRADFLAAVDAGLQLSAAARPASIAHWREELMRTQSARSGSKPTAAAAPAEPTDTLGNRPSPFDEEDLPLEPEKPETLMENQGFRALFYGLVGICGGAIGGALAAILAGTLINPECSTDSCIGGPLLPALAAVGALVGAWLGVRAGRQPPPPPSMNDMGRY